MTKLSKIVIYFDMDDVLAAFSLALEEQKELKGKKFPHHDQGFYSKVKPIHNAITAYKFLEMQGFTVRIATAPSTQNPETYTGKVHWVKKHMGERWVPQMIIIDEKNRLIGDYLIDDRTEKHGQDTFEGELIHTPLGTGWNEVINHIMVQEGEWHE